MRRLWILLVLLPLTAATCIPQRTGGFPGTYDTSRTAVVVADIPFVDDDRQVLDRWNALAGWPMLVQDPERTPNIRFFEMFPEWWQGPYAHNPANALPPDRKDPHTCAIFWNPAMTEYFDGDIAAHEIGHCLGFPDVFDCANEYDGVMDNCVFWKDRSEWFGPDDRSMVVEAGLTR